MNVVFRLAVPLVNVTVPSVVVPLRNCTLPVGTGNPGGAVTVAVRVTVTFIPEGLGEELRVVVVAALVTVWVKSGEVLGA